MLRNNSLPIYKIILFCAIVSQFLINGTGGQRLQKRMTKCDIGGEGAKKCRFLSDLLFE